MTRCAVGKFPESGDWMESGGGGGVGGKCCR